MFIFAKSFFAFPPAPQFQCCFLLWCFAPRQPCRRINFASGRTELATTLKSEGGGGRVQMKIRQQSTWQTDHQHKSTTCRNTSSWPLILLAKFIPSPVWFGCFLLQASSEQLFKQGARQTNEKHNAQGKSGHVSRPDLAHPNPSSVSLQIVYKGWCRSRPNFCTTAGAVRDRTFGQGLVSF